jgi:hypothetical protein
MIVGTAFDSLRRAPLSGADVLLRGSTRRATADTTGRFRFDSVAPGAYTVELTHPALDAAGVFALTARAEVTAGNPTIVRMASPSLATVWQRLCGRPTPFGVSDSAIVYGTVSDAATGTRYAGAAVQASWRALRVVGATDVSVRPVGASALTDSVGTYVVCGVTTDVTVRLRAYASGDSSGSVEVSAVTGPLVRRDFTIGRAVVRRATLRGVVLRPDGITRVPDAQVIVEEGRQRFADRIGAFLIDSLPAGTRWLVVRAVGHTPTAQAVDLRDGDTTTVRVTLEVAPVVLDTVRVETRMSKEMAGFEERRKTGFGFMLTEEQVKYRTNMRAVFIGVPQLRVVGPAVGQFSIEFQLPSGATCTPTLYIDGRQGALVELYNFVPSQIAGVEFYSRVSTVPARFQNVMNPCGVVVLWTKTLQ